VGGKSVEISKESLYAHYNNYSDEALLEAAAAGPEGYSDVAWGVIQELIASRQLTLNAGVPDPLPVLPTLLPGGSEAFSISPYFILSRLLRAQRWPAGRPLPLAGRRFIADLTLYLGGIGALATLIFIVLPTPAGTATPSIATSVFLTALALAFGLSGRRPLTPVTWRFTMLYFGAHPVLATIPLTENGVPEWRHGALAMIGGALWLLYFARRREAYGLPPWPSIL
jgi:hypothetical protein